jgi:hypothetical protein
MFIQNVYFSIQVGGARRKYGVPYPFLYAVPGMVMEVPKMINLKEIFVFY